MGNDIGVVRGAIIKISKKNVHLRKIIRKVQLFVFSSIYKIDTFNVKTDEKTVIFSSFNGRFYSCTPKAVYEHMLSDKKYEDYNFIWFFNSPEKYEFLKANRNTSVVEYRTRAFNRALAKAKYWVFNYRVNDDIKPRENQVYIQCWHGTPLKRLGYDLSSSDNVMNSTKEIRDKYRIDAAKFKYILSPSPFATEKFISAWNLKAIGKENCVAELGYPRNDFLSNFTDSDVERIKSKYGFSGINKKIILYAPTWRDNQHSSSLGYTYKTEMNFDLLRKKLGDDCIVLFRAHYLVANSFDFDKYKGFVYDVSHVDDINELYVMSDMLITDYSSVFFDYAILERPIIFYMYDLEEYKDDIRGFYIELNELPGKIITDKDKIVDEIKAISSSFTPDEKYKSFNKKFNSLNDGNAAARFVSYCID